MPEYNMSLSGADSAKSPRVDRGSIASTINGVDFHVKDRRSIATRVIEAQKSNLCQAVIILALAIAVSFISTILVITTRPTALHGAELVNKDGIVVQTGRVLSEKNLIDMPSLYDPLAYDRTERIHFVTANGMHSEAITGWTWSNFTRMAFQTALGSSILVDEGSTFIMPGGGIEATVAFSANVASGTPTGSFVHDGDLVKLARESCLDLNCSAACSVTMSPTYATIRGADPVDLVALKHVSCNGASYFTFPGMLTTVDLVADEPGSRRRLGKITTFFKACKKALMAPGQAAANGNLPGWGGGIAPVVRRSVPSGAVGAW